MDKEEFIKMKGSEYKVDATVKDGKPSVLRRLVGLFIGDSKNIKESIVKDIVIPNIKNGLSSAVNVILFGTPNTNKTNGQKFTSYSNYYYGNKPQKIETYENVERISNHELIFSNPATRVDVERIINDMCDIIDNYDFVSINDLYELVMQRFDCRFNDISNFTNNKFGWYSLGGAKTLRVTGGWKLVLPVPVPRD